MVDVNACVTDDDDATDEIADTAKGGENCNFSKGHFNGTAAIKRPFHNLHSTDGG